MRTKPRGKDVEDESIHSFISRRFDSNLADNMVDPLFKGIVAGDIKNLSASALLGNFYDYEKTHGSITNGMIASTRHPKPNEAIYDDLSEMKEAFKGFSVWRLANGLEEMVGKIVDKLSQDKIVKMYLNEPIEKLEFNHEKKEKSIDIVTKTKKENVDIVISSVYSKHNAQFLPDKYAKLNNLLSKIDAVSVALLNIYFKQDILPVKVKN